MNNINHQILRTKVARPVTGCGTRRNNDRRIAKDFVTGFPISAPRGS
jgi:hypothetical protein